MLYIYLILYTPVTFIIRILFYVLLYIGPYQLLKFYVKWFSEAETQIRSKKTKKHYLFIFCQRERLFSWKNKVKIKIKLNRPEERWDRRRQPGNHLSGNPNKIDSNLASTRWLALSVVTVGSCSKRTMTATNTSKEQKYDRQLRYETDRKGAFIVIDTFIFRIIWLWLGYLA